MQTRNQTTTQLFLTGRAWAEGEPIDFTEDTRLAMCPKCGKRGLLHDGMVIHSGRILRYPDHSNGLHSGHVASDDYCVVGEGAQNGAELRALPIAAPEMKFMNESQINDTIGRLYELDESVSATIRLMEYEEFGKAKSVLQRISVEMNMYRDEIIRIRDGHDPIIIELRQPESKRE